jgi:hypothetical protein
MSEQNARQQADDFESAWQETFAQLQPPLPVLSVLDHEEPFEQR